MAIPLVSDFTYYEFEPAEFRDAKILLGNQIAVIQNRLCMAAGELINVEDSPESDNAIGRLRRAKLQGEIAAYRLIINESNDAKNEQYVEAVEAERLQKQKEKFSSYGMFQSEPKPATQTTEMEQ